MLPVPRWLAAHTEPNIEAIVAMLGAETQQLYLRYLADEVRRRRSSSKLPVCVLAFDRANQEVERRNRARHPDLWPGRSEPR